MKGIWLKTTDSDTSGNVGNVNISMKANLDITKHCLVRIVDRQWRNLGSRTLATNPMRRGEK